MENQSYFYFVDDIFIYFRVFSILLNVILMAAVVN